MAKTKQHKAVEATQSKVDEALTEIEKIELTDPYLVDARAFLVATANLLKHQLLIEVKIAKG